MGDDFHGLIRACAAAPDDDTVRLVLADWLDDRGESAWARFIRVQIELEPHRGDYARPGVIELEREERQLLRRARAWLLRISPEPPGRRRRYVFERGLPRKLRVPLHALMTEGARLIDRYPTVDTLAVVVHPGQGMPPLLPVVPQVRHVELYGQFDLLNWATSRGLAFCPRLESLQADHFFAFAGDLLLAAPKAPAGLRDIRLVDYTGLWEDLADNQRVRTSPSLAEYRAAAPQWSFEWVRPYQGVWHHGDEFTRGTVAGLPFSGPGVFERWDGRVSVVRWLTPPLQAHAQGDRTRRSYDHPRYGWAVQLLDWWDSGQCHVQVRDRLSSDGPAEVLL